MKLHWVLSYLGKWHAWPNGGRETLCGRMNIEHMRQDCVTRISQELPALADEESFCMFCTRKAGIVSPPSHTDPTVNAWIGVLRLRLRHARLRVADVLVEQLAILLAEVGLPTSLQGVDVFAQVQQLLLKPTWTRSKVATLPHLKEALSKLPLNSNSLLRIANTISSWQKITHHSLATDNFNAARCIETILQIPTLEPYILHLHSRGLSNFASMFHPNTLERARKDSALRGMFAGSNDYWERTESQLNIVTE